MRFLGLSKIFVFISCLSTFDKIQIKKNLEFFDQKHVLTPLGNCDFWDFKKFLLLLKKVSFLSRTLLNLFSSLVLTKTKERKNWHFFAQKHGLTPLEKYDFYDFQKCFF